MAETTSLLVRTLNIALGRDVPPGPGYGHARRKLLAEMCAVMVEDKPDIVLLQELAVGNVHADPRAAPVQLERAGFVLERFARGAPMIPGGDLNAGMSSAALRALVG